MVTTNNKSNSGEQFKKKLLELIFKKKSFYFSMVLCIALVGITVVAITMHNISSNSNIDGSKLLSDDLDEYAQLGSLDLEQAESSTTMPDIAKSEEGIDKQVADITDTNTDVEAANNNQAVSDQEKKETQKSSSETAKTLILPVFGKSILEFATDKMVYSKTLEQWRTHSGIDMAADRGTAVKAAADGIVADVKNDPRYGVMVIVDHQNGLKTVYANLANGNIVNPNQIVKQGDIIGSIGDTASLEAVDQPHLHFEVLSDDKPVDPTKYLPTSLIKN